MTIEQGIRNGRQDIGRIWDMRRDLGWDGIWDMGQDSIYDIRFRIWKWIYEWESGHGIWDIGLDMGRNSGLNCCMH